MKHDSAPKHAIGHEPIEINPEAAEVLKSLAEEVAGLYERQNRTHLSEYRLAQAVLAIVKNGRVDVWDR